LDKFANIIEQFQRQHEAPLEQIAAALAALVKGDVPLLATEEWKQPTFADARPAADSSHARPEPRSFAGKGARGARAGDRAGGLEAFRIEVGHAHQVKPGNIVGAIAGEPGLPSAMIGRIAIFDDHSIVDLPGSMPGEMFRALKKVWVAGRQLNISRLGGGRRDDADRPKRPFAKKDRKPRKKPAIANA